MQCINACSYKQTENSKSISETLSIRVTDSYSLVLVLLVLCGLCISDSRSASVNTDEFYNRSQHSLNISTPELNGGQYSVEQNQDRRASSGSNYMSPYHHHQQQQQYQQQMTVQNTTDPSTDPSFASRLAALPEYRLAPDYATVMKQKMNQPQMSQAQPQHVHSGQQLHHNDQQIHHSNQQIHHRNQQIHHSNQQIHPSNQQINHSNQHIDHSNQHIHHSNQQIHHSNQQIPDLTQNIANTHIYAQSEEGLAYSQPEISNPHVSFNPEGHYRMGSPVRDYPQSISMYTNVFQDQNTGNFMQYRVNERQTNLVMQPTYSSPELNTQGLPQQYAANDFLNVNEAYVYHYKPPPPYSRASNSTPDLAAQTHFRNVSDSPDLVSRRTLGDSALNSNSNMELSVGNLTESIPEVVQISEHIVHTESGLTEVEHGSADIDEHGSADIDDGSSDHSNSTFHIKETDSEPEDTFVRTTPQRQSSKSKITVRFVAPNKAPPPSTSKEVATKRESFRRMMIARSGSFTPGVLRENSKRLNRMNRSLRANAKNSIEEHILETNRSIKNSPTSEQAIETTDPVRENVKNVLYNVAQNTVLAVENGSPNVSGREVMRSQSDTNKTNNKVEVIHAKAVSLDSSAERQQLLDKLKYSEAEVPSTINENERLVGSRERLVDYEDSDSDQVCWIVFNLFL